MRPLKVATLVLVMAAAGLFPASPVLAVRPPACAVSVKVPGVGKTCRTPEGLYEVYAPRTGRLLGLTHGPDRAEAQPVAAAHTSTVTPPPPPQRPPVCTDVTDHHIELVYARPGDKADQYASKASTLRTAIAEANWVLNAAAQGPGGGADYKVRCVGGVVGVWNAVLPTSKNADSFGSILQDLGALGYGAARTKYLVLYDDTIACGGCGGISQAPLDDRLSSDNKAIRGPTYGVVIVPSTRIIMHEVSHTIGAVQGSAPHSTGAGHCYDGNDIMCYNDGGPRANLYKGTYCSAMLTFDCNKDDYFNAAPGAGNYLATHWNLGSRLNRYLRFPPAPDTKAPTLTVTEPKNGMLYFQGCSSRSSVSGTGRPVFSGKGCILAAALDAETGVDRLEVFFDGRLIVSLRQLPMGALSFDLGRGTGLAIPLTIVATDFAEIPNGPNVTTTTILVDVV